MSTSTTRASSTMIKKASDYIPYCKDQGIPHIMGTSQPGVSIQMKSLSMPADGIFNFEAQGLEPMADTNYIVLSDNQSQTAAAVESGAETFAITDGQTITAKVDQGAEQTATINGGVATITSGNAQNYALTNGMTLTMKINGGSVQTATFETGDFVDIGAATAAEIAAVIDTDITGVDASDASNYVKIDTDGVGTGFSIEITGGTANTALDFSTTPVTGTGDAADMSAVTASELNAVLNADISGATASIVNTGKSTLTSDTLGAASFIEVTGGTANAAVGFSTTAVQGSGDTTVIGSTGKTASQFVITGPDTGNIVNLAIIGRLSGQISGS